MAQNFLQMSKSDGEKAAYRVASNQIVKGTKAALITILNKQGGGDYTQALTDIMETEAGNAIVSLLIGYSLTYAPKISEDARFQKLSEEFRVNGMATAGNAVIGVAMEELLPVITSAMELLPPEEKVRVAELNEHSNVNIADVDSKVKVSTK